MDALALLCNLHGDGPETLRRLRAAGCLDLAQVGGLPRAQLDRLLGRGSLAAERFRREGRLLEKRLGGDVALADGVAATDALGRSNEAREAQEWGAAGRGERRRSETSTHGATAGDALAADGASNAEAGAAEAGGLVHPFPPRKQPASARSQARASEGAAGGSVLGAFLDRWRDAPQEQTANASNAETSGVGSSGAEASDEAPSAIRQLAEWARQTRASQAGIQREAEQRPTLDGGRPTSVEPSESDEREPQPQRKARGKRSEAAPAAESVPPPRTSGRASELLDHWAAQSAPQADARPTAPDPSRPHESGSDLVGQSTVGSTSFRGTSFRSTSEGDASAGSSTFGRASAGRAPTGRDSAGHAPAGGTPLGRLPGGERCGPSLEALAFAGLTCLEDLAQAPARQLAERSGLAYTEVLRLQFLAERYLSRS